MLGRMHRWSSGMRLDAVTIGEWKNLKGFCVNFDETSPYTVLVGENGSGKSNLIEALTLIFRNLDLDLPAPFPYRLKYRCRGHNVSIDAMTQGQPRFSVRDSDGGYLEIPKRRF